VLEHGGLIDAARREELVRLVVHLTAQQTLLDGLAPALVAAWGAARTAELFPWRELLDAGVGLSAGTDHPIGPLAPLRAIHGMTTRTTPAVFSDLNTRSPEPKLPPSTPRPGRRCWAEG
jgi:predicted amidohydrolase YtcJ